ncbi:hypothetical protein FQN57_005523 [Myotisia sp. PD_48]|nr:hypothetical protein FQN57_005523 [Myotisia sp. PD_48]
MAEEFTRGLPTRDQIFTLFEQGNRIFEPNASLVLVGIRASGKRSLGFIAAAALKRELVTEDRYFTEATGFTRKQILEKCSSEQYRQRVVEVFKEMLLKYRTGCVLEVGIATLTHQFREHLRQICDSHPVIYIVRDRKVLSRFLRLDEEKGNAIVEQADTMHRCCSNFEYFNLEDHSTDYSDPDHEKPDRLSSQYSFKLKDVKRDFIHFLHFILGKNLPGQERFSLFDLRASAVQKRQYTHAISVRTTDFLYDRVNLEELDYGGDAIIYCANRWFPDIMMTIAEHIAQLRRRMDVPIIFAPTFPRAGTECLCEYPEPTLEMRQERYFALLFQGLRLGTEFLVVDLSDRGNITVAMMRKLLNSKGKTKIIGSYTLLDNMSWQDPRCVDLYMEGVNWGCDIVRILGTFRGHEDNVCVQYFARTIKAMSTGVPLIAYNTGRFGRTSQIFNPIFTEVTHPAIKRSKATIERYSGPDLTAREAVQALFHSYVLDPLRFFVFGASVSYSLSPAMHNAAFKACGMKHSFVISSSISLDELKQVVKDPTFGGASIVQPWRVSVGKVLNYTSLHAEAIGAVNSIMPLRADWEGIPLQLQDQPNGRNHATEICGLYGDNTDWQSIFTCFQRHLSPRNAISSKTSTGLVIGAGGMARAAIYAMIRMGCYMIYIYNRTIENAKSVTDHFKHWIAQAPSPGFVDILPDISFPWPSNLAFPSIIASCVPANSVNGQPPANFTMPEAWLGSPTGGVLIELAYNPLDTPLLKQMRKFRNETGRPWVLVDGLEALAEQGIAQFEVLTGCRAPRLLMRREVVQNYRDIDGNWDEILNGRLERINCLGY